MARGCEDYAVCVSGVRLSYETFSALRERVRFVGVTENFKEILRFYHVKTTKFLRVFVRRFGLRMTVRC